MLPPPTQLNGADIHCWVTSQKGGFYQLGGVEPRPIVCAMSIAQYAGDSTVYLFKCDVEWHVVADLDFESIDDAKQSANHFADNESLLWSVCGANATSND